MSTIPNYKGGIKLSGGLAPKGDGTFPLMEAHDIVVDETGKRLDEKLGELGEGVTGGTGGTPTNTSQFRGHDTGFVYKVARDESANANNFTREGHYFLIHGTNVPYNITNHHGFLDVDYFDGDGFAPSGNGATDVIKQTFRPWNTNDSYVRTYDAQRNGWTAWDTYMGTNLRVGVITIEGQQTLLEEENSPDLQVFVNTVSRTPLGPINSIESLNTFMSRRAVYTTASGYFGSMHVMGLYYDTSRLTTYIHYYDSTSHMPRYIRINEIDKLVINFTEVNYL